MCGVRITGSIGLPNKILIPLVDYPISDCNLSTVVNDIVTHDVKLRWSVLQVRWHLQITTCIFGRNAAVKLMRLTTVEFMPGNTRPVIPPIQAVF